MIIKITKRAKKQIEKLSQVTKLAIAKKIREMSTEQENLQIKKMQGYDDMYRIRVGQYRIVYQQVAEEKKVLAIQHRKDVYRGEY